MPIPVTRLEEFILHLRDSASSEAQYVADLIEDCLEEEDGQALALVSLDQLIAWAGTAKEIISGAKKEF